MSNNMASKRGLEAGQASSSPGSAGPPAKRMMTQLESVKIGQISTLEELDMKVLQFQNKKLTERIEQRRRAEEELRKRIEQLQQRQTTDDAVLVIVNRYWNQLDEDVRVLLQRFDAEAADDLENKNESEAVTSFVALLSTWDKQEIEQKLGQRVEFSKRAIGKLLQAYDRILQRNQRLLQAVKNAGGDASKVSEDTTLKEGVGEEDGQAKDRNSTDNQNGENETPEREEKVLIEDALKNEIQELQRENKRLHEMVTQLHQRHHETTLKNREIEEKLTAAETELAEFRNNIEELEYDLNKANEKIDKRDRQFADISYQLRCMQEGTIKVEGGSAEGVSKVKFHEILHELEEQRELATNRFTELEKLQKDHQEALKEVEKLKMDLAHLPESVVVDTTEYKCLQSQFSVLYNEIMQMKTQLEEARNLLQTSKNTHLRQTEQMESDELACQKKLRTEVIQLEDTLAQVRKEYEMLRIEFEQTLAANEQTGPINREMRNLITSLKNHNEQLKGEVGRYKRKLKEAQNEIAKLKSGHAADTKREEVTSPKPQLKTECAPAEVKKDDTASSSASSTPKPAEEAAIIIKEEEDNKEEKEREKGKSDADIIKDLKAQLKKSQDSQKEMKLLLDMYKSAPKEQRDKVQLMSAEKKAKQEIEDLKAHIRKMQEAERKERRKLAEDDAIRKIKKMEESIQELTKNLHAQKQEEEALLNEMEVTGQAFEDMQEQNIRLLQQLKEKDDANFKLMSERIKSNQIHKLLKEEKDVLAEQVSMLLSQVEAQNLVVRKLEEKERILQNNLATVEKESSLRQQAMEMHKRKAVESSQTAADLKLHLDKYHSQLKDAQIVVAEKTSALEQNSFKHKRMQEDVALLRRKLERAKKIEMAGTADEVLMEEIREYKEQLTCPSCKVKKKDAVLTKCFHVFCLECLKTRYETRQRKCPKCNAAFGANDFHRIYLD